MSLQSTTLRVGCQSNWCETMKKMWSLSDRAVWLLLPAIISAVGSRGLCTELPAELVLLVRAEGRDREVVLHKYSVPTLTSLADYIARNLRFCDQVAFMGLELMGFAKPNEHDLWIDPMDYGSELQEATSLIDRAGIPVSIYNLQHCVVPRSIRRFCRRSISDWKNEYLEECDNCQQAQACGGFFSSTASRPSRGLAALTVQGEKKNAAH